MLLTLPAWPAPDAFEFGVVAAGFDRVNDLPKFPRPKLILSAEAPLASQYLTAKSTFNRSFAYNGALKPRELSQAP